MGKLIWRGFAKLGEIGQSGGAFITGANLASRPKPKKDPEQQELPLEDDDGQSD